jgi:cell division protein FtsL
MDSMIAAPSFVARGASPSAIRRAVDRRGLAIFAAALSAALLLSGVLLFATWSRTRVTAAGYALSKAVREHQQLLREREALLVQVSHLRSPGRLREVARKLRMGPAPASRTVVIVDGAKGSGTAPPLLATHP